MRSGLSLIELVAVLLILGVAALVAVPALPRALVEDDAAATAGELARVLGTARRAARERGVPVRAIVDPARRRYRIETETAGDYRVMEEDAFGRGMSVLSATGPVVYRFAPTGSAGGDSLAVVAGGARAVLLLDTGLGEARVLAR